MSSPRDDPEAADGLSPAAPPSKSASPSAIPEDEGFSDTPAVDLIEAEDGVPEEDEFLAAGWEASSSLGSTSVTSSIYAHTYENGRRYHSYKYGRYPIPNDDIEQNREDMKHAMIMELTNGQLFYAPIGDHPQKIIDLGTGTGIWAIEMGDLFPSAEVLGLDLSPIQPSWLPPNVKFMVDDVEDEWASGSGWDFAHFRGMALVLRNLQKAVDQTFRHLKPGGWIEFQDGYPLPHCDDGTMSDDDVMKKFYLISCEAMRKFGMNLDLGTRVGEYLERAGFINVQCVKKKMPLGTWPKDKTMRLVGMYMKEAALQTVGSLTKAFANLGMSAVEREVLAAKVNETLNDNRPHRYYYYYFWYAQKPEKED